jgi:Tfp pilus assembly protein PilN
MMPRPLNLEFVRPRVVSRQAIWLLSLLSLGLLLAGLSYFDAAQTVSVLRSEKKARETVETTVSEAPRRSAEETRALRQEVQEVNRQIRQLNQAWEVLFGDLRSFPGAAVRLLAVDVDARTGSVRVTGLAADATTMADYAAYLAEKKSLRAVVLSRHEADAGGLRFVVDGKWTE